MDKDPTKQKRPLRERLLHPFGRKGIERALENPLRAEVITFAEDAPYCDGVIISGADVISTNSLFPTDPRQMIVIQRPSSSPNQTDYLVPMSRQLSDAQYIRNASDAECWGVKAIKRPDGTITYIAQPKSAGNELRGHTDSITNDSTYVVGSRIISVTIGQQSAGHGGLLDGLRADQMATSEDDPSQIVDMLDAIRSSIHAARSSKF